MPEDNSLDPAEDVDDGAGAEKVRAGHFFLGYFARQVPEDKRDLFAIDDDGLFVDPHADRRQIFFTEGVTDEAIEERGLADAEVPCDDDFLADHVTGGFW